MGFTIQWCLQAVTSFPRPNICVPSNVYTHYTLPWIFTHHQWMLWWMSMVEVITSHLSTPGSLAGQALGDCPTTASCGIIISSLPLEVGLHGGGAGTSVPCMMDTYIQGNASLWCNEKKPVLVEDAWPSTLVHHVIG